MSRADLGDDDRGRGRPSRGSHRAGDRNQRKGQVVADLVSTAAMSRSTASTRPASAPAGTGDDHRRIPSEARQSFLQPRILVASESGPARPRSWGSRSPRSARPSSPPGHPEMSEATTDTLRQASSSTLHSALLRGADPDQIDPDRVRSRSPGVGVGRSWAAASAARRPCKPHRVQPVVLDGPGMLHVLGVDQPGPKHGLRTEERRPPVVAVASITTRSTPIRPAGRQLTQRRDHRRVRRHLLHPASASDWSARHSPGGHLSVIYRQG